MKLFHDFKCGIKRVFESRHETWMFFNQLSRIISGFVIIAFLARLLQSEILGVWYIFVAIFGMSAIAEMGLNQVFMRHIAYIGAEGINDDIAAAKLFGFTKAYRKVYLSLVSIVMAGALLGGVWWLFGHVNNAYIGSHGLLILSLWIIYVLGGGVQLFSTYYSAIISGLGDVATAQRNEVIGVLANASLILILLAFTQSLVAPVVAFLVSRLVLIIMHRTSATKILARVKSTALQNEQYISITKLLGKDVSRMALIMLAYQLLTSGLILIFSNYESALFVASYGLTNQVIIIVISLTGFWIGAIYPQLAACHVTRDYGRLRKLFFGGCRKTIASLTSGLLLLMLLGGWAIDLFGSKTPILAGEILLILILTVWVEIIVGQFAQLLLSQGDMRFAYFSLIGSIAICLVAIVLFSNGHTLIEVLLSRLILYFLIISLPIVWMSKKYLLLRFREMDAI